MERESLLEKTIMFELGGKNQALHEYDKMLWNLRIGYLTLFFTACGLLVKAFIDNEGIYQAGNILYLILIMSFTISFGAFAVDYNYVKRKYRVIRALNLMYEMITEKVKNEKPDPQDFIDLIKISGTTKIRKKDSKDLNSMVDTGLLRERWICFLIYFLPLTIVLAGFVLLLR